MRTMRLWCAVVLVGCLASAGRVSAQCSSCQPSNEVTKAICHGAGTTDQVDTDFVHDMVSILNETQSPDAFLATVLALHRAKVEGKRVVPAIILNAERLKLFADTPPEQGTEQQKAVLKCVLLLLKGANGGSPVKQTRKARMEPNVPVALFQSEDRPRIQDEWGWFSTHDQPAHMTYRRVHGGVGP